MSSAINITELRHAAFNAGDKVWIQFGLILQIKREPLQELPHLSFREGENLMFDVFQAHQRIEHVCASRVNKVLQTHGTWRSRQRSGVLQSSEAFRGPVNVRKRRRAGALQDAAAQNLDPHSIA